MHLLNAMMGKLFGLGKSMSEHHVHKEAIVTYSAEKMYTLVNDIPAYPLFVPWCVDAEVVSASDQVMCGRLTFSSYGFRYAFSTRNTLKPNQSITLELEDGPFTELQGVWLFEEAQDSGCRVSLDLKFSFTHRTMDFMFRPLFEKLSHDLVAVFVARAHKLYASDS